MKSHHLRWFAKAAAFEAVVPEPDETLRVEPPLAPRDEAIFLLHAAAEIEHELMLQYLYAAYSLPENADERVAGWRAALLDVAREEMGHFLTVQNLLRIIGGPLRLGRTQSPDVAALRPFPYALEPFTRGALAKYIVAEMPRGVTTIADVIAEAEQAAGQPCGALHRVGRIYVRIEELLQEFRVFDRAVELRARQGSAAEWGGGPTMFADPIEDPAAAMAALRRIAIQGEGLDLDDEVSSHFERFLAIYRTWPDGLTPARPVPVNPRAADFSEPRTRAWAELLNLRYRLLLATLGHGLALAGNEDERRPLLVRASLAEMRFLTAIARRLTTLATGQDAYAGPPFELPYTTDLADQEEDRWRHYLDVLARSRELCGALGMDTQADDAALLASIAAADEELRGAAAEWSRDADSLPVLVVGTGPAGLAAAAALARSGVPVRLIDSSPIPGGKVNSEQRDGRSLEHGIHGWWMNYLNFDRLMRWSGVDPAAALQDANGSALVLPDGRYFPLRTLRVDLPSPIFLAFHILGSRFLANSNLLTAIPFFLHVLAFDHARDYDTYDTITFEQLMDRTRVARDLRERLLEPFILSFDFAVSSRVSAACGLSGIQFYLIPDQRSIVARWANGLPHDVIFGPILKALQKDGVRIELGTRLESVIIRDGAVRGARVTRTSDPRAESAVLATLPLADLPQNGFRELRAASGGRIWAGRLSGGDPVAFDATCPHAGCAVVAAGERFDCPCHGSVFDADGRVQRGPAATDLVRLQCRVNGAILEVRGAPRTTTLLCRDVVIATDVEAAKRIVAATPGLPPPMTDCLSTLGTSPVIVIRLWFDSSIQTGRIESCITPEFPFIDNFFDLNEFDDTIAAQGHVMEVQSYRVDEYLHATDDEILAAALHDLAIIHPSLRGVRPLHWTINRHVALFTRYAPNEHGRRPSSESGVPGCYFAGDWTRSDWSVWMMERGVVSGLRAANSVLRRRGRPEVPILRLPKEHWLLRFSRAVARAIVSILGLRKRVTR